MAERPLSQYDVWARTYDQRWRHYMDTTLSVLLAHLTVQPDAHILDIGCGTGTLLAQLAALAPTTHLAGVDASRGMLRVARRKLTNIDHVSLYHGSADNLPLADETQDIVTIASMLHYARRPSQVLTEARRVLRSGGTVAIIDYVPRIVHGSVVDGLIRHYDAGHVRSHDRPEMAAMLAWAGFTSVELDDVPIDRVFRGVIGTARRP